ncbi:C2 domain containing protein [Reticulomyxa filosa]|uniref:Clathrin light chain n=1 Tax=Reticulomyxa filosa TaxID=46433 RepID=X6M206_RETFI|nr:C2 domain containing protein [Reticulomyxa filosa]|eukprot:ETO08208.1 C2 domain containing protein [Reticulomyxa filosa]
MTTIPTKKKQLTIKKKSLTRIKKPVSFFRNISKKKNYFFLKFFSSQQIVCPDLNTKQKTWMFDKLLGWHVWLESHRQMLEEKAKQEKDEQVKTLTKKTYNQKKIEHKIKLYKTHQDKLQKQAKDDIQKFHDDRKKRIAEAKKQNKYFFCLCSQKKKKKKIEEQLREDLQSVFEHGTVWEQVSRMVNLQDSTENKGPSGDQERMRKLLIDLKNDKKIDKKT